MTAQLLDMPADQYHARPEISHTMLKAFKRSPRLFQGLYLTGEFPHPKQTPEMLLGSMVHDRVLLDGKNIAEIPADVLNKDGHRKGASWLAWAEQCDAPYSGTAKELAQVDRIAEAVWNDRLARMLLSGEGDNEKVLLWRHEMLGLNCRSMIDRLTPDYIIDLKTTNDASPRAFAVDCHYRHYHAQASFYRFAVEMLTGRVLPFIFIAVEKEPPYSVRCYELDSKSLWLGNASNEEAMGDLSERMRTGDWAERGEILTVSLPHYAFNDEWELTA